MMIFIKQGLLQKRNYAISKIIKLTKKKMSTSIAEKEKPVDYLPHGCAGHLLKCPRL